MKTRLTTLGWIGVFILLPVVAILIKFFTGTITGSYVLAALSLVMFLVTVALAFIIFGHKHIQ